MDAATGTSFALLAAFMLLGLWVYERRSLRLGGVLVMPLLVVYALFDLAVLPVFLATSVVTFAAGEAVHRHTLLYGRRLFVVYLITGIAGTFVAGTLLGLTGQGLLMAVLPGLFAFNLHREGRPVRGAAIFVAWVAGAVLGGTALLLLAGVPAESVRILGPPLVLAVTATAGAAGGLGAGLQALAALLGEAMRTGLQAMLADPATTRSWDTVVATIGGAPGAGGLSVLGVLDDLLGGGGE